MNIPRFVFQMANYYKLGIIFFLLNIYDVGSTLLGISSGAFELNPLPLNVPLKIGLCVFLVLLNLVVSKGLVDSSSRFYQPSKIDGKLAFFWFSVMFVATAFYFCVMLNNYEILAHLG